MHKAELTFPSELEWEIFRDWLCESGEQEYWQVRKEHFNQVLTDLPCIHMNIGYSKNNISFEYEQVSFDEAN